MAAGWTRPTVPSDEALAEVHRIFAERHASATAPSTVYGVLAGGRTIAGVGFGAIDEAGTRPTIDTAYRIASVTKSFTAAALLILRDRGLVDLDETITSIVPTLRLRTLRGHAPVADPTLRMLLTMSAGLPGDDPWADRQESLSDDEFDAVIGAGVRLSTVPGTTFEYSNLGYALLGRVIQARAGRRFHDVISEDLLTPLRLTATGWDERVGATGGVATGFEHVDGAWVPMPFSAPGAFSSIGGLFSTVRDLTKWMQWFIDADLAERAASGPLRREPLSAAGRREMQQGQRLRPGEPLPGDRTPIAAYGFGLIEQHDEGGTVVYHSGGYPGFSSHIRWHPASGIGIAAVENATYSGAAAPAAQAMRVILDSLDAPTVRPTPATSAAQADVMRLVRHGWDDALADGLFTSTVALDAPFDRRRSDLEQAVARGGRLGVITDERSDSPTHRAWTVRGEHADLRIDISMHPLDPPLVQSLDIEVHGHSGDAGSE